jgi:DNA invertase Pin-like site-specific DNA recombinase
VSTAKQADDGESLEVQQRMMTGYGLIHGIEIGRTFIERGVSGSVPLEERPEGRKLMSVVEKGDVVITAKLDRMFRSALDALNVLSAFRDRGIGLHMIDVGGDVTNGISKLMFTILSAFAEAERDRIRERIQQSKADGKERGIYLGGKIPYGFAVVDGVLVADPEQQLLIARMLERAKAGESLRQIKSGLGLDLSLGTISRVCSGARPGVGSL